MAKQKKPVTVQSVIKELLDEGPLAGFYFVVGINVLKERLDEMTNEEIVEMFTPLLHPDRVRQNINTIYERVNNFDREVS